MSSLAKSLSQKYMLLEQIPFSNLLPSSQFLHDSDTKTKKIRHFFKKFKYVLIIYSCFVYLDMKQSESAQLPPDTFTFNYLVSSLFFPDYFAPMLITCSSYFI